MINDAEIFSIFDVDLRWLALRAIRFAETYARKLSRRFSGNRSMVGVSLSSISAAWKGNIRVQSNEFDSARRKIIKNANAI